MRKLVIAGGAAVVLAAVVAGVGLQRPANGGGAASSVTVGEGSPLVKVSLPETLSPRAQIGEIAFNAKCATCHGTAASGRNGMGPPLVHPYYRPGHHGDQAFFMAVQNGVRAHHWNFGDMPPVKGLTRADVLAIIAYVRALQQANGVL